jgi:hypothetical protein
MKRYKKKEEKKKFEKIQWIQFKKSDKAMNSFKKLRIDYLSGKEFKDKYIVGIEPKDLNKVKKTIGGYSFLLVLNKRGITENDL